MFESSNGARPDATRILVVISDGRSFDAVFYPSVIALADKMRIIRYAIGV